MESASKPIKSFSLLLLLFLGQLFFFGNIALERLIARDEGYYLLASKLVMEGKLPYLDFFYPQMPLLPYVYGAWMKFVGFGWFEGRLLSAILSSFLGLLVFKYCKNICGIFYALIAVVVYCSSNLVYAWFLTCQTYVLSTLLLFISFYLISFPEKTKLKSCLFIAGIFAALAVDVRLFFAGVIPLFFLILLLDTQYRAVRQKSLFWFGCGIFIGLLPNLFFVAASFETFQFNNLEYHLIRSNLGEQTLLNRKCKILRVLFGYTESRKFEGFQYPLFLYLSIVYLLFWFRRGAKGNKALLIGMALFGLNFLPSPAYVQYFSTTVPFLIIVGLVTIKYSIDSLAKSELILMRVAPSIIFIGLLVIYLWSAPSDIHRYTQSGKGVIGIGKASNAKDWRVKNIIVIKNLIDQITEPGEEIIVLWPGYLVGSHARVYPGLENHFAITVARKLEEEQRELYKILSRRKLLELLRSGTVNTVVLGNQIKFPRFQLALQDGGYKRVAKKGLVTLLNKAK